MYSAKIILDSIAPCGRRLTTIESTYPRFIHSEVMTHRDRERNAASSRAIPWSKMRDSIVANPVVPIYWGAEQKGMQTGGEIDEEDRVLTRDIWLEARDDAVRYANALAMLGVHKSICNRLVEPFSWMTVVMTATEWKNFFRLRCHSDAEVHFQKIACMIRDAMNASTPLPPPPYAQCWHLPYVTGYDLLELCDLYDIEQIKRISAARCARVSYLTQNGARDPSKDIELFNRLAEGSGYGHWSPTGHVALAMYNPITSGPFLGWFQFRKEFPNENEPG
jgi:hypothetical protein